MRRLSRPLVSYLIAAWLCLMVSCDERRAAHAEEPSEMVSITRAETNAAAEQQHDVPLVPDRYPWLDGAARTQELTTLQARFAVPQGYQRVPVANDSFAEFLRGLPLLEERTTVRSHTGQRLSSPAAAIVALDVGKRNLQQCADTIIRLHAEYLWSRGRKDELAYHFTSGDETRWSDWRKGERFRVSGATVERVQRDSVTASRSEFHRWLETVFMYAGTRSLAFDSDSLDEELWPGDFFVDPGSPGHAVLVLDVVTNDNGDRLALLGQGFMPAQEFHVIRGVGPQVFDRVWFRLPVEKSQRLDTPSWHAFSREQARRFNRE